MNDFRDDLAASVASSASFDEAAVAGRVGERRRRRRRAGLAAVVLVAAVGVGVAITVSGGDDGPDVEAVDDPPTPVPGDSEDPAEPDALAPVVEDPVGADGVEGVTSDLHVETTDTFGFAACGADGEPGPPTGDRATELETLIDALRDDGLHDQPFVVSSGGPQSIWGVPSVGLSSRYEPTLRWIADRADPADVCVEFPEFGVRNLPPELADVEVGVAASFNGVTVTAQGCEPKGEWVAPFLRLDGETAELGIAVGRGQDVFTDDCPTPTTSSFAVAADIDPVIATEPGTLFFAGAAERGAAVEFTFDPVNAASATTIGDDLVVQLASDPTVQFQVSDVFSGNPVVGAVGEVATDQWPITGAGTIVVPEGVPAGTYHVRLIADPELNGTLEVVGSGGDTPAADAADWGWLVPDLDGDGAGDVVDGATGQLRLTALDSAPLVDRDGAPVTVPIEGDHVFTCNPDGRLYEQWDAPIDDERLSRRLAELVVADGVAEWVPSPSFVFDVGDAPLPPRGQGCEPFGEHPSSGPGPVIEGEVSDIHVEATDIVFPECESLPQGGADEDRLAAVTTRLRADGVMDQPFVNSVGGPGFGFVDAVDVILQRRYQPTLDWLAARAEPDELCLLLLPTVGFHNQPPSSHEWDLAVPVEPDDTSVTLNRAPGECISSAEQYPPMVRYMDDRIEIALPVARAAAGVTTLACIAGGEQIVELAEPVGERELVPWIEPTMTISSQLDMLGTELDDPFTVTFDPAGLGDETTMGDDVIVQSVDDPSVQIQIGGVFTDSPTAGDPAPIVTDRWEPDGEATLIVPGDTPPGDYTFVFIEHPQFWGLLTVA